MTPGRLMNVLLLDDDPDLAAHYKREIESHSSFRVVAETSSLKARSLAEKQLFDAVVIDAKLDYRGYEYGGVRLADELAPRYGNHSILVISRYVTAEWLRLHGAGYDFLEKHPGYGDPSFFRRELCRRLRSMRKEQYAFVAMPFAREHETVYKRIKEGVSVAGFKCVRADEVAHTRSMQGTLLELLLKSKFVVFLADGANANAYYEAGFADALKKEVVIVAKDVCNLLVDVRDRLTLIYGDKAESLDRLLAKKISALVTRKPPTS